MTIKHTLATPLPQVDRKAFQMNIQEQRKHSELALKIAKGRYTRGLRADYDILCEEVRSNADKLNAYPELVAALRTIEQQGADNAVNHWPGRICSDVARALLAKLGEST